MYEVRQKEGCSVKATIGEPVLSILLPVMQEKVPKGPSENTDDPFGEVDQKQTETLYKFGGLMYEGRKRGRPRSAGPIKFADLPCCTCGGPRDHIHSRYGQLQYRGSCRKCTNEARLGERRVHSPVGPSEWDIETARIYHGIKWKPKVREGVKTTYKEYEFMLMETEKFGKIIDLALNGKVKII